MHGLDAEQLLVYVIRPTLNYIGMGGRQAEALVLGTGMAESGLRAIQQYGGPARSIFQIEPATHDDIWDNYIKYRPGIDQKISGLCAYNDIPQWRLLLSLTSSRDKAWKRVDELWGNMPYATAMARLVYRRSPKALPPLNADKMAHYWKDIYNTSKGKGDPVKAAQHFENAINYVKRN